MEYDLSKLIPEQPTDQPIQDPPVDQVVDQAEGYDTSKLVPEPEGTPLDVVWEPIQQIAGSAVGEIGGGLAGLGASAAGRFLNAAGIPVDSAKMGSEAVEGVQQYMGEWGAPETKRGREATEWVGGVMKQIADLARVPISGVGGIADLIFSGGDIDKAANTVTEIQERGVNAVLGDRVFDATGSPLLASVFYTSPDAVLAAGGFKAGVQPVTGAIQRRQTRLQRELAGSIMDEPVSAERSTLMLTNDGQRVNVRKGRNLTEQEINALPLEQAEKLRLEQQQRMAAEDISRRIGDGSAGIKNDPFAQAANDLGWDPGVTSVIKSSTPDDWRKMKESIQIWRKAKDNPLYGLDHSPADVAGDSLQQRILHIDKVRSDAGKQIKAISPTLKGKRIDVIEPVRKFVESLLDANINIFDESGNLRKVPDYSKSRIEVVPGAKRIITATMNRIRNIDSVDALEVHNLKQMIDELVNYGKSVPGGAGSANQILSDFRHGLNQSIRDVSPEYAKVNDVYRETKTVIDDIQSSFGSRIDLKGEMGATQLGQELRKIMSNYNTRAGIYKSAMEADRVANKYGGGFVDDIRPQILFVDEMDRAIGTPARRRAFETLIARGTKGGIEGATGGSGIVSELLAPVYDKIVTSGLKGQTPENRVQAIEALLDSLLATEGSP